MIRENTKQTNWMSGRKHKAKATFDNKVLYKVFFILIQILIKNSQNCRFSKTDWVSYNILFVK